MSKVLKGLEVKKSINRKKICPKCGVIGITDGTFFCGKCGYYEEE